MKTINEGFKGQQLIVIPDKIQKECLDDPIINPLFITDIGYFPCAANHMVERNTPISQNILLYCVNGEGWCKVNNQHSIIKKDRYVVIPSSVTHSYGSAEESQWEIYWVHFKGEKGSILANKLSDGNFGVGIPYTKHRYTIELFKSIINIFELGITIKSCSFASMKLWHFMGNLLYSRSVSDGQNGGTIEKAIKFMAERAHEYLSLDELSRHMGLSPSYFCRVFKNKTGHTPIDYFLKLKIQLACKFLDLTDMKIKDISEKISYDDPYYFSRIFKQTMGCSPMEYRKRPKNI